MVGKGVSAHLRARNNRCCELPGYRARSPITLPKTNYAKQELKQMQAILLKTNKDLEHRDYNRAWIQIIVEQEKILQRDRSGSVSGSIYGWIFLRLRKKTIIQKLEYKKS